MLLTWRDFLLNRHSSLLWVELLLLIKDLMQANCPCFQRKEFKSGKIYNFECNLSIGPKIKFIFYYQQVTDDQFFLFIKMLQQDLIQLTYIKNHLPLHFQAQQYLTKNYIMNSEPEQSQQPLQTQTQRFLASFNKHCQKTHPNVFKNFAQLLKLVEEHMFDKDEQSFKQVEVQDIEEQLTKALKSAKAHHKKGVLIIGPPGVGKTAFMKYYARRNFKLLINANCCNLVSVFKNRATEVIDLLFQMANFSDQTILFFDEIDLLTNDEHSFQNIQTIRQTLLKNAKNGDYETPTVYSTNKPWKIDTQAFLETIHCSIQIPISSFQKRKALIKLIIKDSASENLDTSMLDPDDIAQRTLNYLNSDIYVLIRQMMMEPYKQMIEQGKSIEEISKQSSFKIQEHHVNAAYNKIKPSILVNEIDQYRKWQNKFEQGTL